jgi:hypothetical protein
MQLQAWILWIAALTIITFFLWANLGLEAKVSVFKIG